MQIYLDLKGESRAAFIRAATKRECMQWFSKYFLETYGFSLECFRPINGTLADTDPNLERDVNSIIVLNVKDVSKEIGGLNDKLLDLCRTLRRNSVGDIGFIPTDLLRPFDGLLSINGQKLMYRNPEDIVKELEESTGNNWVAWYGSRYHDDTYMYSDSLATWQRGERTSALLQECKENPPNPDMVTCFQRHILHRKNVETKLNKLDAAKMFGYVN